MKQYKVKVKHDNGSITFQVIASNEEDAINKVMKAENCPRCAITSVKKCLVKRIS